MMTIIIWGRGGGGYNGLDRRIILHGLVLTFRQHTNKSALYFFLLLKHKFLAKFQALLFYPSTFKAFVKIFSLNSLLNFFLKFFVWEKLIFFSYLIVENILIFQFSKMSSSFLWLPTFLLILPILARGQNAGGCDSKQLLGTYLGCLKTELDREYGTFEEELKAHTRRAAGVCFAQNIGDANKQERCVLAVADLDQKAWDRNGPLRDCSICRTFATGAIKAILSTPAEEQKCIRVEISKAIAGEAETCLRKKVPNFSGVPEIPDLEEGAFSIREQVIDSISDYIWIHSRLAFCAERKPERATSTKECLKSPFLGYYQKHCQALNTCDLAAASPTECLVPLKATKGAVCECIDEARDDLKRRIAGIADAIREAVEGGSRAAPSIGSGSKVDQCVANIKRQLITPTNDWAATIDNALNSCIKNKPSTQNLGIDSLLNVGCRKIIADNTGTAQGQIRAGFEFVNNLIDAMVERSRRFCGGAHCDGPAAAVN